MARHGKFTTTALWLEVPQIFWLPVDDPAGELTTESKTGEFLFVKEAERYWRRQICAFGESEAESQSASWRDDFFKDCAVFDEDGKVTPLEADSRDERVQTEQKNDGGVRSVRMWIRTDASRLEAGPGVSYYSPDKRWLKLVQGAGLSPQTIPKIWGSCTWALPKGCRLLAGWSPVTITQLCSQCWRNGLAAGWHLV